ncbi:MAG: S-layer homology domain-containing protein [Bacillota bacterium]
MNRAKRVLATILTLVMLMSLVSVAGAASGPFADVPDTHELAAKFGVLKDLNIYVGYPDGTARPDEPITRAQFAAVVVRMLGPSRVAAAKSMELFAPHFADTDASWSWAWGYVNVATALGIIHGYPDGTFRPNNNVTFAEAFKMIIHALKLEAAAVGVWPTNYLMVAYDIGLDKGLDVFANLPITRGEMALAVDNALVSKAKWNAQTKAIETGTASDSLLVKAHKWSVTKYNEYVAVPAKTVTGKYARFVAVDKYIRVDGIDYEVKWPVTTVLNKEEVADQYKDLVISRLGLEEGSVVTLTLNEEGKVTAISVTVTTYSNKEITGATITDPDVPDQGTITVGGKTLNVDANTEILLNGKAATLTQLKAALDAFKAKWATTVPGAIASVRTYGDDLQDNADAIWVSVVTESVVKGKITAKGTDNTGNFVRIDGTKYYVEEPHGGSIFNTDVGTTVTVLLGLDGKVRVNLQDPTPSTVKYFAKVLYYETYVVDSQTKFDATFELADGTKKTLAIPSGDLDPGYRATVIANIGKVVKVTQAASVSVDAVNLDAISAYPVQTKWATALTVKDGTTDVAYALAPGGTFVYCNVDAAFKTYADIKAGDTVKLVLDDNGFVAYIVRTAKAQ